MTAGVGVLAGVRVLRALTTADLPAGEAESEMHPSVSHVEALLATVARGRDLADLVDVLTCGANGGSSSASSLP